MSSPIRTIIFDLGNVLINFDPEPFLVNLLGDKQKASFLYQAIIQSAEWLSLDRGELSINEARASFSKRYPEFEREIELFTEHWLEIFSPIEENVTLLPKLRERGYQLYVLSNLISEAHQYFIKHYNFITEFDGFVASYDIGYSKPDPAIYRHLLNRYHLKADECLFFDDLQPNVDAAKAFGIQSVLCDTPAVVEDYLIQENLV